MRPNHAFHWADQAALQAFAAEVAVAHLFAEGASAVAHAPVRVRPDGTLWFHHAVEVAGRIRRLARGEPVAQLDALSPLHEARACKGWTRAKMDPKRFEALLGAQLGRATPQPPGALP
jgi:predicted FMN-binding regulatory protein PaiB